MKVNKSKKISDTFRNVNDGDFFLFRDDLYLVTNVDNGIVYDFSDERLINWRDYYDYDAVIEFVPPYKISINIED